MYKMKRLNMYANPYQYGTAFFYCYGQCGYDILKYFGKLIKDRFPFKLNLWKVVIGHCQKMSAGRKRVEKFQLFLPAHRIKIRSDLIKVYGFTP